MRGGIVIAVITAGLLAACMPRGKPLSPEEARIVQANLVQMEARVTQQLRDSLEARGLRPATAEEVVARLTGNTTSMSGGGGTLVTYYLPDGTIKVQLTTLKGEYRSDGTWTVDGDGIRCVTVDELRKRRGYDYYDDQLYSGRYDGQLYSGRWATVHETNCYEVYFGGPIEYWFRVSGPHHLDSGESDIVQGRAFYL
ncbi:MAG: hypothetical protein OXP75_19760 [Rhodospirillales bacterium]|nr:hypothetical protein [Rhodospirillales bacterium]